MLKMTHLSKVYRTEVVETYALRDFNIDVKEGEFVAVTGPSGSGKTTFLTIAGLLETFTGGEYHLDGIEVSKLNDNARSKIRNEKIGFIFQAFNLIPDLNVFDNVEVPLRYRGMKAAERKQRIMDALERVGLASRAKHYPAELSGGQQQRVAIARALAGCPRLLLADEPTGNLDTQMARGVLELLEEIHREGATIVMVTHDPELAARAQRNVHIIDGQVVDLAEEPRFHAHAARPPRRTAARAADREPRPARRRGIAATASVDPRIRQEHRHVRLLLRTGDAQPRRNPVLTALMVMAIGFGVAASMTTFSVFRAVSGDPIPWKSSQLFVPQIDNWGPNGTSADGEPPNALDYTDAMALMRAHAANGRRRCTRSRPRWCPADASKHPFNVSGHAVYSDFFPMFDVPFQYGSGWSAKRRCQARRGGGDQQQAQRQAVRRRQQRGPQHQHRRQATTASSACWTTGIPQPRFYDVVNTGGFSEPTEDVFLPFTARHRPEHVQRRQHQLQRRRRPSRASYGCSTPSCVWIAYMVELDDAAAVARRIAQLPGRLRRASSSSAGRFTWAPNNRLRNVPDWLDYQQVVPQRHQGLAAGRAGLAAGVPGQHRRPAAGQVPASQRRDRRAPRAGRAACARSTRSS